MGTWGFACEEGRECGGIHGVGSGLTQACTDMVGVYVVYACVGHVQACMHMCRVCVCVRGAHEFSWGHLCGTDVRGNTGVCPACLEGSGEAVQACGIYVQACASLLEGSVERDVGAVHVGGVCIHGMSTASAHDVRCVSVHLCHTQTRASVHGSNCQHSAVFQGAPLAHSVPAARKLSCKQVAGEQP